jgi:hypothetical protein
MVEGKTRKVYNNNEARGRKNVHLKEVLSKAERVTVICLVAG